MITSRRIHTSWRRTTPLASSNRGAQTSAAAGGRSTWSKLLAPRTRATPTCRPVEGPWVKRGVLPGRHASRSVLRVHRLLAKLPEVSPAVSAQPTKAAGLQATPTAAPAEAAHTARHTQHLNRRRPGRRVGMRGSHSAGLRSRPIIAKKHTPAAIPRLQHPPASSGLTVAPAAPPSPPAGSCSRTRSRLGSRSP